MSDQTTGFWTVVLALYFIPSLIAALRRHHQAMAVFLTNLFLGWTFLGWVVALIWSVTAKQQQPVVVSAGSQVVQPARGPSVGLIMFVIVLAVVFLAWLGRV